MFGGSQANAEGSATITLRDTWEFDGTQWQQVGDNGPDVIKPIVVYDAGSAYGGNSSSSSVDPERPIDRFFYVRYNQQF